MAKRRKATKSTARKLTPRRLMHTWLKKSGNLTDEVIRAQLVLMRPTLDKMIVIRTKNGYAFRKRGYKPQRGKVFYRRPAGLG